MMNVQGKSLIKKWSVNKLKQNKLLSLYIVFLLVISIGATAFYQMRLFSTTERNLEELDEFLKEQNFSGSVLVGYKGDIVFEESYGFQDKKNNIKNTSETAYLTGSITKQFTAASILQLQEKGKLDVTDTVDKFYPNYPNGENITIHQLLTHTAGLPEYLDIFEKDELVSKIYSVDEVMEGVQKLEPKSKPGEKFEYNNTDYFMLGGIIEKVSGESFEDYVYQNIFEPAGMVSSAFGYDSKRQLQIATGYMNEKFEIAPYVHPTLSYGGGAFSSTVLDLYKWDRALYGDKILTNDSKKLMFTSHTEESLMPGQSYGYGQYVVKEDTTTFHPGFITGFSSNIYRDTEKEIVVIALSNTDSGLLPMIPAMLKDFSERIEGSYIGFCVLALLYLVFAFIIYTLFKWTKGMKQGTISFKHAKWYRITFQTVLLQLLGLIFLVIPLLPGFAHEMFSSQRLLLVVAPLWGSIVNLSVLLFVLLSIAAIQPFVQKIYKEGVIVNAKNII